MMNISCFTIVFMFKLGAFLFSISCKIFVFEHLDLYSSPDIDSQDDVRKLHRL